MREEIELEYADGSSARGTLDTYEQAWRWVEYMDPHDTVISAWRNGEPWFGRCTDFREGQP